MTEDIYAGYGGVMNLSIDEVGAQLFVYGYGIIWANGQSFYRNDSAYLSSGGSAQLGILIFGAPAEPGPSTYSVVIKVESFNENENAWYDYGPIMQQKVNDVVIQPLDPISNYTTSENPEPYYDTVNSLVNFQQVQFIVDEIHQSYPGDLSVLQIADAYSWMKDNIAYKLESDVDHWPSVNETLSLRTADCKGQSVLMASIVTALGGSVRVNIIDQHAFPTVFIGSDPNVLENIRVSLASYYGLSASQFHIAYLHDQYGYWLVIDPDGFPYCGGIPAQSGPSTVDTDAFQIQSSYLYEIDVNWCGRRVFLRDPTMTWSLIQRYHQDLIQVSKRPEGFHLMTQVRSCHGDLEIRYVRIY